MFGQVTDDFSDGDFATNPSWTGTNSKFVVSTNVLKLQAPAVAENAYMATSSSAINNATWEFVVRMDFNPSSTNYTRVYLVSDQEGFSGNLEGYFVMLGNTNDEVCLYKQSGSTKTKIIDGIDGRLNLSLVNVKVKVTRDDSGNWELFSDVGSTGTYTSEGNCFDNTFYSSAYFGVYCEYSSTRSDKFYFDDFLVTGNPFVDNQPPSLDSLKIISANQLSLVFSEDLNVQSTLELTHYFIEGIGNPSSVEIISSRKVNLNFNSNFQNGITSTFQISGIKDLYENAMAQITSAFLYFEPSPVAYKDIVLTEVFPDYSPVVGLPEAEFVEIQNRSENPISLENWQLTDGSTVGFLPDKIILPGEIVVLTSNAGSASFATLGTTLALSAFPTLNNNSDRLKLKDANGVVIDSLNYDISWYRDEDKQNGGWTLEIIDPDNFCKGDENWIASNDPKGGTPGHVNSVDEKIVDNDGPRLISVNENDSITITLIFNEKLFEDTITSTHIEILPTLSIDTVYFTDSSLKSLSLRLSDEVVADKMYTVTVSGLHDCPGNLIDAAFSHAFLNYDTIPPKIDSVIVIDQKNVRIYFSEKLEGGLTPTFSVNGNANVPNSLRLDERCFQLEFPNPLENGIENQLVVSDVTDINGNTSISLTTTFLFFEPMPVKYRDIIITEIFADPSPVIGLPEQEFVEIYNASQNPVQLKDWILTDGSSIGTIPNHILLPDTYLILTSVSSAYDSIGKTVSVKNFPTINNSGETLRLLNAMGEPIDSVRFSSVFYHDDDKKVGGWTMEMVNLNDVCKDQDNWRASTDLQGGTPGKQNSVFNNENDLDPPQLQSINQTDSATVTFTFNEKLSTSSPSVSDVTFIPALQVSALLKESENTIICRVTSSIDKEVMYTVSITNVLDCPGNLMESATGYLNLDTIPPAITNWVFTSPNSCVLTFNERINVQLLSEKNFSKNDSATHPSSLQILSDKEIQLVFPDNFENGNEHELMINNVSDINGNSASLKFSFLYFVENPNQFKDVIISEFLPDPSASNLFLYEFVEIYNRGVNPVDLKDWSIADQNTTSKLPSHILKPGDFVILTSSTGKTSYESFGPVLGLTKFPSLNNDGDVLILKNNGGLLMDSISYSDDWYQTEDFSGLTLELIDPENLCAEESNWKASESSSGGTPGSINSVNEYKPDLTPPILLNVDVSGPRELIITFNEKLSATIPANESISFEPELGILNLQFADQSLRKLKIELATPIQQSVLYKFIIERVSDCAGNYSATQEYSFAKPDDPAPGDFVINEILFNPPPNGVDFIELYNVSNKILDLKSLLISHGSDLAEDYKIYTTYSRLFFPFTHVVLTQDINALLNQYPQCPVSALVEVKSLPSLPDDEGSVSFANASLIVIDKFAYNAKMQSPFIKDDEGVSLERISISAETQSTLNWKSASQLSGYGTPGLKNSNAITDVAILNDGVEVTPQVFKPQSGVNDFALIKYSFPKGGWIANVRIFDAEGRLVRTLTENELLGTEGFLRWDGDYDSGQIVRRGYYMINFEVYDDNGNVKTIRKPVAIAAN